MKFVLLFTLCLFAVALAGNATPPKKPSAMAGTTDWNSQQAYIGCLCFNEQECFFHECTARTLNEHIVIGDDVVYEVGHKTIDKVGRTRAIVVGDVDGDGNEDLVACGRTDSHLSLFLNTKGDGEDFTLVVLQEESNCDTCRDLQLIDYDNDGDLDIAFASQETNKLGWFENPLKSSRKGQDWEEHVVVRNATKVAQFRVADVNHDGLLDWIAASFCEGDCGINCDKMPPEMKKAIGMGMKKTPEQLQCEVDYPPLKEGYNSFHAWIQQPATCDGDECTSGTFQYELISANHFAAFGVHIEDEENAKTSTVFGAIRNAEGLIGSVVSFQLNAKGEWEETLIYNKGEFGLVGPDYLLYHDVNLDGKRDLIVASREGDGFGWLEEGKPGEQWTLHDIAHGIMDGPKHLDVADFDGDGDLDVTAGGFFDDTFNWFENPTIPSEATEENGGKWVRYMLNKCCWGPSVSQVCDLNKDGKWDIVTGCMDDGKISWFNNVNSPFMKSKATQRIIDTQNKREKFVFNLFHRLDIE